MEVPSNCYNMPHDINESEIARIADMPSVITTRI